MTSTTAPEECGDQIAAANDDSPVPNAPGKNRRWLVWLVFGLIPVLTMVGAGYAGYLSYRAASARAIEVAQSESVRAATDGAIALLSYRFETVDQDVAAASARMTEGFRDSYAELVQDVVIPGAKEKHISVSATVPAVGSVSATPTRAVVLVFINQNVTQGDDLPTNSTSSVRITLDKVHERWLISAFDPV